MKKTQTTLSIAAEANLIQATAEQNNLIIEGH